MTFKRGEVRSKARTHISHEADVAECGGDENGVDEGDPCGAGRPAEVFPAVGVHVCWVLSDCGDGRGEGKERQGHTVVFDEGGIHGECCVGDGLEKWMGSLVGRSLGIVDWGIGRTAMVVTCHFLWDNGTMGQCVYLLLGRRLGKGAMGAACWGCGAGVQ